ncbi:MAG: glycosyltransferase [Candidatus Melainabacteria bacterium]|nr:glycosyltransferase [Candidatus Melainabacteria bacterium]
MRSAPNVLAIVPSLIASCQINVLKPLKVLASQGRIKFRWRLESRASLSDVHWADVVIFCRNTEPAYGHLLNEAVCTSKPIIYDLDDNFWDIPYDTDPEIARYHRLPPRLLQLEQYLQLSTFVRVYSPVLGDRVSEFSKNVKLLRAGFDFSLAAKRRPPANDKVRIVYATSRVVDDQYYEFLEGIIHVLDKYGDCVSLTIWGCQPSELAGRKGVELMPLLPSYERFLREFYRQGFDIGLAPLPSTLFHRSKNNTKFRDYGACRVAGIYSDVDVYSSCIQDGCTGVLVQNNPESWASGMSRLIEDRALTEKIKRDAYAQVYKEYRQELVEEEWMAQINELLSGNIGYAAASPTRKVEEMRVRSDFHGLCAIRMPGESPDGEKVGQVLLEILTPTGDVLRDASSCKRINENGEVLVSFEPIANSDKQEFVFRLISTSEETDVKAGWLPSSGLIQMLYVSSPDKVKPPAGVVS